MFVEIRRSWISRPVVQVPLVSMVILGVYIYLTSQSEKSAGIFAIVKGVVKFFLLLWGRIEPAVCLVFLDIFLMVLFTWLSMALFAQYGLPVRTLGQRLKAMLYLPMYFFFPRRGPLARVDNGELPEDYPRREPRGLGVIYLDTASAALLRKPGEYTRAVGPGLVFARPAEYVAETVDLHRQTWPFPPFGPLGDAEDPFAPFDPKIEKEEEYQQRQERRSQTSGTTRDGVEVVPQIFAVCRLDTSLVRADDPEYIENLRLYPEWGGNSNKVMTNFGYSDEAVRRAVLGGRVDPRRKDQPLEDRQHPWYQLPTFMAVDLWREYLRKFSFEELFQPLEGRDAAFQDVRYANRTALEVVIDMVAHRLCDEWVDAFDAQGNLQRALPDQPGRDVELPDGRTQKDEQGQPVRILQLRSREFVLLRERGTKVLYVPIRGVRFAPRVEDQLINSWFSFWLWRAKTERENIERLRSFRQRAGELEAQREFAVNAARLVDRSMAKLPRSRSGEEHTVQMERLLEVILRGTLAHTAADTNLNTRLINEKGQILQFIDWLRRRGKEQE